MKIYLVVAISLLSLKNVQAQNITDDFEGNGTISTWFGDDCEINTGFANPYSNGINTSSKVLRYSDLGSSNFNLNNNSVFSLKIYVPSAGITGNQTNQVSLKLQNKSLGAP
jgi:hypothetical protein